MHPHSIRSRISDDRGNEIKESPCFYSLPKRPGLRCLLENQNNKGSLQKTHWRSSTRADHKVLNEGCESRDNHRYAVVVQDLATQWIKSHPCKTKSSHDTEKSLSKFLEPSHRPKVVKTDNSMEFGTACEVLSWNHRTSTPHRSETHRVAEEPFDE